MEKPRETLRFGTLLRDYRLALGWTQATLAEQSGLSVRGIQHLEGGETQPYRYTVEQLAEALKLSADERRIFEAAAAPTPRRRSSPARQPSGQVVTGSPTGTATLMFVQVVPLPTAQRGLGTALAVGRCLDLIQTCLERHEGTMVRRSPRDGAHVVVFARASQAVVAAMQLRDALQSHPDPRLAELRMRVALHTGEAHLWQGEYRGPAIEEGARLMASAGWGQTLLSEATAILARDVLPAPDTSGPQFYDIDDVVSQDCSVQRIAPRSSLHPGQGPAPLRPAADDRSTTLVSPALSGADTGASSLLLARA
jgi:class 3 adenylate cyclase